LLPSFITLSSFFSSVKNKYTWTASAAYLSDKMAGIVMVALLSVFVVVLSVIFSNLSIHLQNIVIDEKQVNISSQLYLYSGYMTVSLINLIAIVTVNIAYVFVTINYDGTVVQVTSFSLAVFKIVW